MLAAPLVMVTAVALGSQVTRVVGVELGLQLEQTTKAWPGSAVVIGTVWVVTLSIVAVPVWTDWTDAASPGEGASHPARTKAKARVKTREQFVMLTFQVEQQRCQPPEGL